MLYLFFFFFLKILFLPVGVQDFNEIDYFCMFKDIFRVADMWPIARVMFASKAFNVDLRLNVTSKQMMRYHTI